MGGGGTVVVGEVRLRGVEDLVKARALITPALGLSDAGVTDCVMALTEAAANALTHGKRNDTSDCLVRVELAPDEVRITVEDHGGGFHWNGLCLDMPSLESIHGRGVPLIRTLMDSVAIRSSSEGTRVHMTKRTVPA